VQKEKKYVSAEYVFAHECISRVAPFATISSLLFSSRPARAERFLLRGYKKKTNWNNKNPIRSLLIYSEGTIVRGCVRTLFF